MNAYRPNPSVVRRPRRTVAARRASGSPYLNKKSGRGQDFAGLGKLALLAAIPAFLLFGIGFLVWGPTFSVKEIKIDGATPETSKSIETIIYDTMSQKRILPFGNIFFFDKAEAATAISGSFSLDGLEIRKRLPGTIELTVREKTVRAAFLADGRFLGLDGTGMLIRELTVAEVSSLASLPPEYGQALAPELGAQAVSISDEEAIGMASVSGQGHIEKPRSKMPIIAFEKGSSDAKPLKIGDQAADPAVMRLALQSFDGLEKIINEPVQWFIVRGPNADSLEAVMESGWKAYFTASQQFELQANKLSLILKDKVGDRRKDLEYVDLRYGERIFFKFKDA